MSKIAVQVVIEEEYFEELRKNAEFDRIGLRRMRSKDHSDIIEVTTPEEDPEDEVAGLIATVVRLAIDNTLGRAG